jgi:hypothetical protein
MRNLNDSDRIERERVERQLEYRRESEIARDNANAAGSFALGIALIALVGIITAMFVFNRNDAPQAPVQPSPVQQQPPDVNINQPPDVNLNQPPDVNINVQPEVPEAPVVPQPEVPEAAPPVNTAPLPQNPDGVAPAPAPAQP